MTLTNSFGHHVQMPGGGAIPRKADMSGIIPRFFTQEVETGGIDPETGLKQFRSVEYVELLIPGDRGSAPVKRVNDEIRAQYRDAYQAFKDRGPGADMIGNGIPLKLWGGIKAQVARGLEAINVFTVQQLAGLSDQQCSHPGTIGLRTLRDQAKTFLESAAQTAPIAAVQAELEQIKAHSAMRDKQLEEMIAKNNDLTTRLNALGAGDGAPSEQMPEPITPRNRGREKN